MSYLKPIVAKRFSDAAATYALHAPVQEQVALTLAQQLTAHVPRLVNIGSGTGFAHHVLTEVCDRLLALDIAPAMLRTLRASQPVHSCIQADMDNLPLTDTSTDAIYSSLALQWSHNINQWFSEAARVLTSNGQLHVSTLLPGTLHELNTSLKQVGCGAKVNRFIDKTTILETIKASGLELMAATERHYKVTFSSLFAVMHSLKHIGAHTSADQTNSRPLTPNRLRIAQTYYCEHFAQGANRLPVSYRVLFLSIEKKP